MKKHINLISLFIIGIVTAGSLWLISGVEGKEAKVHNLVVLHTNDTHGHPVKFFKYPAPDVGGLPARATLIKEIRNKEKNVLLLDAGDINIGRMESNYFKAEPDITGYNSIGYDAMALGNHEFDNSLGVLRRQMKLARFPFLAANVKTNGGEYLAKPYIIKKIGSLRVAVFGLTTRITKFIGNPSTVNQLYFEDEVRVAERLVPLLRNKADIVIALVHMGIYSSGDRGSKRLAREVPGIDLIVDGHTHTRMDEPLVVKNRKSGNKTIIVQAWKWGLVLGRADLKIKEREIIDYKFKAIPINLKKVEKGDNGSKQYQYFGKEIKEDKKLLALLKPYLDKVENMVSEVIGHAEKTFLSKYSRHRETALGNLIADSMLWQTKRLGADFALQNGGGIRADLPEGEITRGAIHEIIPFDNTVIVLTLEGKEVQELFNYMATKKGKGGFPQISRGLRLVIDPVAKKCENALINGQPLDLSRHYKIATNSYLARGGDNYRIFLNAIEKDDTSMMQREVLIDYIRFLGGKVRPKTEGRFKVLQ